MGCLTRAHAKPPPLTPVRTPPLPYPVSPHALIYPRNSQPHLLTKPTPPQVGATPETQLRRCHLNDWGETERELISDPQNGIESREVALALRRHRVQTVGDALYTKGIDPHSKYKAPVCDSQEYGWRVPTPTNGRTSLEMFGVSQHARKAVLTRGER